MDQNQSKSIKNGSKSIKIQQHPLIGIQFSLSDSKQTEINVEFGWLEIRIADNSICRPYSCKLN